MSLTVFFVSASIWAFFCVLAAFVSAAAVDAPGRYRKAAMVGLVVGAIFGLASVGLVADLGVAGRLYALLSLVGLGGFVSVIISVLLAVLAGTVSGSAVGAVVARSRLGIRRCTAVGLAFGLALGIANATLSPIAANAVVPAIEFVGLVRPYAVVVGSAMMVVGALVNIALAVVAFRLVRRRWGAAPPATATGTC